MLGMSVEEREIMNITDLVRYLSRMMDQDELLSNVWVQGEISNFKHHSRGHMYFTLKDEQTRIRAVMFAGNNRRLRFYPKDGDHVSVRGRVAVYQRDGQVQLYVSYMRQSGVGDLFAAYQELKEKLEEEGVFSPLFKKPLPFLPQRVGVITAPDGAAIRDIITTIQRRSSIVHILLFPVSVQGEGAGQEIADALDRMNEQGEADVVIVGRGGGSLEELWAFNEESVARSIFRCRVPVVSAVGHETDFTISDFAADVRAATPTAAAELVVPCLEDLEKGLSGLRQRLFRAQTQLLKEENQRLQRALERSYLRRPGFRLEQYEQQLDYVTQNLIRTMDSRLGPFQYKLERLLYRLYTHQPQMRIKESKEQLALLKRDHIANIKKIYGHQRERWFRRLDRLDALSPLKVMKRGYSLVYRYHEQELVKSVKQLQTGDLIRVRLSDGKLKCQVWGTEGYPDEPE